MQSWKIAPLYLAVWLGIAIFGVGLTSGQILRFSGGTVSINTPIPAGVTTVAIAGGPTYYGTNGFTKATSPIIFGGVSYPQGWDTPTFIMLAPFESSMVTQNDANLWVSLGLNTEVINENPHSGQLNLFHQNGISVIPGYQFLGQIPQVGETVGNESVGILTYDEPPSIGEMIQVPVAGSTTASFSGTLDSSCSGSNTCLTVSGMNTGLGPLTFTQNTTYNVPFLPYIIGAGVPSFTQIAGLGTGRGGNGTYIVCNTPNTSSDYNCVFTGFSSVGPETMTLAATSGLSSTLINGRFLYVNFNGTTLMFGQDVGAAGGTTPITTALNLTYPTIDGLNIRHVDVISEDLYWFVQARNGGNLSTLSNVYDTSGSTPALTQAQGAKGSHYGDAIDFLRSYQGTFKTPIWQAIETGNAKGQVIFYDIQPVEINWAVWSSFIHGAIGIVYFDESDGAAPDQCTTTGNNNIYCPYMQAAQGVNCTSCTYYPLQNTLTVSAVAGVGLLFPGMQTSSSQSTMLQQSTLAYPNPGGQGNYAVTASPTGHPLWFAQPASMTSAMASTNQLVTSMGPILKDNYALGFITSVTTSGYSFDPVLSKTGILQNGASATSTGIETMVKYYQGSQYTAIDGTVISPNTFYIFADTRQPETDKNISATFNVKSGSSVTVINESRTIPISGGSFSDTFAFAWTVHIYKVNP